MQTSWNLEQASLLVKKIQDSSNLADAASDLVRADIVCESVLLLQ